MRILIDADGCPVTNITINEAKKRNIEVIIFCDTSHEFKNEYASVITVDKGADSADFAIVNAIKNDDIIITQDYGLGAMCLSKCAEVITQNGLIISQKNIDTLLATRHISKKARMDKKHLKGPSKRTKENDDDFIKSLEVLFNENTNCS